MVEGVRRFTIALAVALRIHQHFTCENEIVTSRLGLALSQPQNFAPGGGYLWVAIAYNTSIGIALSALLLFYSATHDLLE